MERQFEWDEEKAAANLEKHGVTFEEAESAFDDPFALTLADYEHSGDEDRWLNIGYSARGRLIAVIYTERGDKIRLITSRPADRWMRELYEE